MLARIERLNPSLAAFCVVAGDDAIDAARASEARWSAGEPCGPLDGVPVSIKDLILTKGWPTRRGSRTIDPNQPWDVDAPATARLREAGAVLVGKTTTPGVRVQGRDQLAADRADPEPVGSRPAPRVGHRAARRRRWRPGWLR